MLSLPIINKYSDYTTYVILTTPRTGSTLLHTYLNNHPNVISLGETVQKSATLFHPPLLPACIQALGFKIFYDNAMEAGWQNEMERLSVAPATKFIWLRRKNTLRQWVSLQAAVVSGEWSSTRSSTRSSMQQETVEPKMKLEPEEFLRFRTTLHENDRFIRQFLKGRQYLEINYEDLVNNEETLNLIWRFLNVRPAKVHSLLTKQHPQPLASIIENFDDFRGFEIDNKD